MPMPGGKQVLHVILPPVILDAQVVIARQEGGRLGFFWQAK